MKKLVVLSGAGVSAESGLKTFRDADGLWEGHDVMQVASIEGWLANRNLVLQFYNDRRRQLKSAKPNLAHQIIADLEDQFKTIVVTQNVDDLHERAGSSQVIHLHGELLKVKSEKVPELVYEWSEDLSLGDLCEAGHQLRPDIVWFGEAVPRLEQAIIELFDADFVVIVGTSLQVYPAASLIHYAPENIPVFYIDPYPNLDSDVRHLRKLTLIEERATSGMEKVKRQLLTYI